MPKAPDHEQPDPQHRHHRARRPRQDHARGPAAAPERHLPREREDRRARDGQQRPRARARHHHPGQELRRVVAGHAHQHRGHPRPRRLRRRGGARALDGRRRAAARGRRGRADAADALRDQEGAGAGPQADRGGQQGRPPRLAHRLRHQRHLRPLRQARRHRGAARLSGGLRLGPERLGEPAAGRDGYRPGAALRQHPAPRAAAPGQRDRAAAAADLLARLLELRGAHRHRPHPQRRAAHRPGRGGVCRPRGPDAQGAREPDPEVRGPGAGAGRACRPRRHRARQRHREHRHRRDPHEPGVTHAAADARDRRADAHDELLRQHLAAGRARGQVRHQPSDPRPPGPRTAEQRGAARERHRRGRRLRGGRARRAAPDDPAGEHAPGGLRARRVAAQGGVPRGGRARGQGAPRADGAAHGGCGGRAPGRGDAGARAAQGRTPGHAARRARAGAARVPHPGAWAHRLPGRVPQPHPRHRPDEPRVRRL